MSTATSAGDFLKNNVLTALLVAGALIGYDHFYREKAAPPPLAAVAAQYRATQGKAAHAVADQVRHGGLKDGPSIAAELAKQGNPLKLALQSAIKANLDDKGNVTNATAIAEDLDVVAKALGGKW